MPRTNECSAGDRRGRLRVAEQFWTAAELLEEFAGEVDDRDNINNAYATLCVHAGIAAADVICCAELKSYARGQAHQEAVDLLAAVSKELSRHLAKLIEMKTLAGYTPSLISAHRVRAATRHAGALMTAARERG